MLNEKLNEQPNEGRDHNKPEPRPAERAQPDDFVRMKDWIRQARSDSERALVHSEQTREHINELREELDLQNRKSRRGTVSSVLLWIALLGAGAYGYFALKGGGGLAAQVPVLQDSFQVISQRLGNAEAQLRDWAGNWDAMAARLDKAEKTAAGTLRASRDFTTEQTAKVQHEMRDEMDNRSRSMEARLARAEAAQQQDRTQLATLQQEVGTLRSESAQQLAQAQRQNGQEFGNLRREINQNRDDFNTFARHEEKWRADFEISKAQRREVAPGLALTVQKTDVARQQLDGWVQIVPDGKILWLRQHGIHQPMLFRNQRDDQTYELVFTRVTKDGAVGYALLPRYPSSEKSPAAKPEGLQDRAALD
jgi:chromosome segregation ATPase